MRQVGTRTCAVALLAIMGAAAQGGCGDDGTAAADASTRDARAPDGAMADGATRDAPPFDAHPPPRRDAGPLDPGPRTANGAFDALGANEWMAMGDDSFNPGGGITAYSSMALDTQRGRLVVFGGGHSDYDGNDVWTFDVDGSWTWTQMYASDGNPDDLPCESWDARFPGATFNPPGEDIADAVPTTRHTYDTMEFISSIGETFLYGAVGWYGTSCGQAWRTDGLGTWSYSLATNGWTYRNRTLAEAPNGEGMGCAYDPEGDQVWCVRSNATFSYDPTTDLWSTRETTGAFAGNNELVLTYDRSRHCLWAFGGAYPDLDDLQRFDIDTLTWTSESDSGDVPPARGAYGLSYDVRNDALLAYHGPGELYACDLGTLAWTRQAPGGDVPPAFDGGGIYGRFKYDELNNVHYLVGRPPWMVRAWAYRYAP